MILFTTIENFSDRLKIERLYMCYRSLMYKEALEIVQNSHSAEDAVSESFVRIIKNLHKIDEQNRPKAQSFLVIICRKFAKYAARAACVLLVIAIGCGVTVYNVEAWRLHFFIFLKAETSIFILKHTALTAGSPLRGK